MRPYSSPRIQIQPKELVLPPPPQAPWYASPRVEVRQIVLPPPVPPPRFHKVAPLDQTDSVERASPLHAAPRKVCDDVERASSLHAAPSPATAPTSRGKQQDLLLCLPCVLLLRARQRARSVAAARKERLRKLRSRPRLTTTQLRPKSLSADDLTRYLVAGEANARGWLRVATLVHAVGGGLLLFVSLIAFVVFGETATFHVSGQLRNCLILRLSSLAAVVLSTVSCKGRHLYGTKVLKKLPRCVRVDECPHELMLQASVHEDPRRVHVCACVAQHAPRARRLRLGLAPKRARHPRRVGRGPGHSRRCRHDRFMARPPMDVRIFARAGCQ